MNIQEIIFLRENRHKSEQKLTFNITYHPAFQNVRSIMEELHILLTPNKEHRKVFPNVPVIRFQNGESLKDFLVRATLSKHNKSGRCETCGRSIYIDTKMFSLSLFTFLLKISA